MNEKRDVFACYIPFKELEAQGDGSWKNHAYGANIVNRIKEKERQIVS